MPFSESMPYQDQFNSLVLVVAAAGHRAADTRQFDGTFFVGAGTGADVPALCDGCDILPIMRNIYRFSCFSNCPTRYSFLHFGDSVLRFTQADFLAYCFRHYSMNNASVVWIVQNVAKQDADQMSGSDLGAIIGEYFEYHSAMVQHFEKVSKTYFVCVAKLRKSVLKDLEVVLTEKMEITIANVIEHDSVVFALGGVNNQLRRHASEDPSLRFVLPLFDDSVNCVGELIGFRTIPRVSTKCVVVLGSDDFGVRFGIRSLYGFGVRVVFYEHFYADEAVDRLAFSC